MGMLEVSGRAACVTTSLKNPYWMFWTCATQEETLGLMQEGRVISDVGMFVSSSLRTKRSFNFIL